MKFDKDMLIKHKFWVILGLILPCSLIGFFLLVTTVAADIAKKRGEIESALKEAKGAAGGNFQNQDTIDKLKEHGKVLVKQKDEVRLNAYGVQEPRFTWPKALEDEFDYSTGTRALEITFESAPKDDPKAGEKKDAPKGPPSGPKGGPKEAKEPPEPPNEVKGTVVETRKDYLMVKDRKGRLHKVYRTANYKITQKGGKEKEAAVFFSNVREKHQVDIKTQKGRYFFDPLTDSEQIRYVNSYRSQIPPLFEIVQPVDAKGKGVVQFPGWTFGKDGEIPPPGNGFFWCVQGDWNIINDVSEEAWLAQEDLWVQKEVFKLVRLANDYVSKFAGTGGEERNKEYKFTNPYWELGITWNGDTLEFNIKNLLNRRQRLDQLQFRIRTNKNPNFEPETFDMTGEPLFPAGTDKASRTIKKTLPPGVRRTGIYDVEQVLTWESAAVRRIDQVCFGTVAGNVALCHRMADAKLKPYREDKNAKKAPAQGGGAGDPMGVAGIPGGGPQRPADATVNGLTKTRYLDVQEGKLRRMPVAVALIVDQDHVDRVQAAFNNSVFRFLTTQVIINRYPGSLRPAGLQEGPGKAFPPGGPGAPGFPMIEPPAVQAPFDAARPQFIQFQEPMPEPMGPEGILPKTPGARVSGPSEDLETNVELVIYGIITIYERPRDDDGKIAPKK